MIWRGSPALQGWLAGAALLTALLMPATKSFAGIYHVYSCRIPYGSHAGEPAPVQVASGAGEEAGRWSHQVSGAAQYAQLCSSGGALAASLQSGIAHADTDISTWQFSATPEEKIVGATLWVAGDAAGGAGYLLWLASPANPMPGSAMSSEDFVSGCVYTLGCRGIGNTAEPLAEANKVVVPAANLGGSHLYINASCSAGSCPSDSGDEQGHAVVVYVYATDIVLEEQSSPSVSGVSGELASAAQVSGDASLDFDASDAGSGVYRAIVSIDGKVLESPVIGQGELCHEAQVPAEYQPAFLSAEPCTASVSGHLSLHTQQLSNGPHQLLVQVTNAAGNATPVIERTIDVVNGTVSGASGEGSGTLTQTLGSSLQSGIGGATSGTPNGEPPSGHASLTASWVAGRDARVSARGLRLIGGFDEPETISGRLTGPGGQPIAGATIVVSATKSYGGAPKVALRSGHSGAGGRFTIRLPRKSPSERLRLTYSPTLGGAPVASQTLTLLVKAGVSLSVTPGTVSAGQTIRLRGRILGGLIPQGGKQVVLEARSASSPWLQFLVLRSGSNGRFAGSHRFRLQGPVRYWFRALCPREADFPYATGVSEISTVWER